MIDTTHTDRPIQQAAVRRRMVIPFRRIAAFYYFDILLKKLYAEKSTKSLGGCVTLNIALLDDDAEDRAQIKRCLNFVTIQQQVSFAVDEFASADSFLVRYQPNYDIVFLDIEFPSGLSGMEAARQLRKIDKSVILIFVTNMAQMAIQGYEVDALDFLVKPLDSAFFLLKMIRALGRVIPQRDKQISILVEGETVRLHVNRIRYLTVEGHYVVYHSREGTFYEYGTLAAAEKRLSDSAFCRCDRGCMVNLRFVTAIRAGECVVDGEKLAIARPRYRQFKRAYADFLSGTMDIEGEN